MTIAKYSTTPPPAINRASLLRSDRNIAGFADGCYTAGSDF
jgi:hypothetical protein